MKYQMDSIHTQSNVDFLHEFESFSNLTIVCSDGMLHSHKVVIASISSYIKQLLSRFPLGDEVTLYLPDFTKSRVERFVNSRVFEETSYEEELARHFKVSRPLRGFLQSDIEFKAEGEEDQIPNDAMVVQSIQLNLVFSKI